MREDDSLPAARLAVVDLPDGVAEEHELGSPIPANPDKIRMNDWMQELRAFYYRHKGLAYY